MYKNFNLTESEKKQILNQHKEHGYKKPLNEQEDGDLPTSPTHDYRGYRIEKSERGGINLQEQLLFIIENLSGKHTEDDSVTSREMMEVLKETIRRFVNPNDTISTQEWNDVYYPITNDRYA